MTEARRAAESFFKPVAPDAPQPTISEIPQPAPIVAEPEAPITPEVSTPPIASSSDAAPELRQVFPDPIEQPVVEATNLLPVVVQPSSEARRVLPDLTSQPDELEQRLAAAALLRRGRKPGSKNKPKDGLAADAEQALDAEAVIAEAPISEPKRRGRPPNSKNKPKPVIVAETTDDDIVAAAPSADSVVPEQAEPMLANGSSDLFAPTIAPAVVDPVATIDLPKRRGRPPNSKNKPKVAATADLFEANVAPPSKRRGRPPGSKNKQKTLPLFAPSTAVTIPAMSPGAMIVAEAVVAYAAAGSYHRAKMFQPKVYKPGERWKERIPHLNRHR